VLIFLGVTMPEQKESGADQVATSPLHRKMPSRYRDVEELSSFASAGCYRKSDAFRFAQHALLRLILIPTDSHRLRAKRYCEIIHGSF
jgi:hypothetical protein